MLSFVAKVHSVSLSPALVNHIHSSLTNFEGWLKSSFIHNSTFFSIAHNSFSNKESEVEFSDDVR